MKNPESIMKTIAICMLGLLAAAPMASAEVDPDAIQYAKERTEIKKIDVRGKKVSEADRVKNASRKGRWSNNSAKFTAYAQIKRDDDMNRILCSQEYTYNKKVIFEGYNNSEIQLVHVKADEKAKTVEATEVETIDPSTGGVYVLFTPSVIYVMNFDALDEAGEPTCRKYENRDK